jgi:glycosyl-4,4'-diaponeurosporenoate acyltransferase
MRLIHLSTGATVALDVAAWLVIHMGIALLASRTPLHRFDPLRWFFLPKAWERQGEIYVNRCGIRVWKKHLPDGARLVGRLGFPKKHLASTSDEYLETFARETCRAELVHWVIIAFAPLFFLWNRPGVGFLMIAYAIAENLPLIMTQRYNRFRLQRVLNTRRRKHAA